MPDLYEQTLLTPKVVAQTSGYIDWATQPTRFKHYPDFLFSYNMDDDEFELFRLIKSITKTSYISSTPYYQLNVPSAGNLDPHEIYVQIRGVKGILSGIYHIDAEYKKLVLIQEINYKGFESLFESSKKLEGMIFLISSVHFRSEWKYGKRALRYTFMDIGHQLASLLAALEHSTFNNMEQNMTIMSNFDTLECDKMMGFSEEEHSCVLLAFADTKESRKPIKAASLMRVAPTSYYQHSTLAAQIKAIEAYGTSTLPSFKDVTKESIYLRRSARTFAKRALKDSQVEHFMHLVQESPFETYSVVLKSESMLRGLYRDGELLLEGNFENEMVSYMVDQAFLKEASIIVIFVSQSFSHHMLISSALWAQKLYLEATELQLGFSGIGAFYDRKLQQFLSTDNAILYVGALGMVEKE